MTIIRHDFNKSEGLQKEMHLHDTVDDPPQIDHYTTVEEFLASWSHKMHRSEVESVCDLFKPSSRVLDIGSGIGNTSIYFASRGHKVTVVEPSHALCIAIDKLSTRFGLDITVHQCSMEHFTSNESFDICIFNASFHHCDEPLNALRNCHASLIPGGSLYLVNEQVLKFYRSKKWYENIRETSPEKVCDYGGNEHMYRISEYRSMIRKTGFNIDKEKVPVYYLNPKSMISTIIKINEDYSIENGREIYSDFNIFIRFIFYITLKRLVTFPVTSTLLKALSLISVTFIAKKK